MSSRLASPAHFSPTDSEAESRRAGDADPFTGDNELTRSRSPARNVGRECGLVTELLSQARES